MTNQTSLAADGGRPVRSSPIAPWPFFAPDEIQAVTTVLESGKVNYWTGTETRHFESEYAEYLGTKHAIAVTNGTVSLELILRAWGVGPGDEVVTTPRTFVGTSTAIVAVGAKPVFADVDRNSQNITAETIERVLTPATKVILPVHLAGWPCEMDEINTLARQHGLRVLEDCAQCHGATYRGRQTGSLGDASSFSFCQDKILTTAGEGGLVATNNEADWRAMWAYKDHGKSYAAVYERPHPPGFRWLVESFGTNWRMTEVQGALGRVILRKLDGWVASRRRNAQTLSEGFAEVPGIRLTLPPEHVAHSYYKYYCFVEPDRIRSDWSRDRIAAAISAEGIACFSGSCSEIYLEKAFPEDLRPPERLPVARELGETSLMFLVHPTLDASYFDDTINAVQRVLAAATR